MKIYTKKLSTMLSILILLFISIQVGQAQDNVQGEGNLNISQTQEGITVNIQQVYADTEQILVSFNIENLVPEGQGRLKGIHAMIETNFILPGYTTTHGRQGGGSWQTLESGTVEGSRRYRHGQEITDPLNVIFQIHLEHIEGFPLWLIPDDFELEGTPPDEYAYEFPHDLNFEFSMQLPVYERQEYITSFSEESNGIQLDINEIILTPAYARLSTCFTLPDSRDWQPDMELFIDNQPAQSLGMGFNERPSNSDQSRCSIFEFAFPFNETPSELSIVISNLYASVPEIISEEDTVRASAILADLNIEANYILGDRGIRYEIISKPDDLSDAEVHFLMFDALRPRFDASWAFTLDLN